MTELTRQLDSFRHYTRLIAPRVRDGSFFPEAEGAGDVQVERGLVYMACLEHQADPITLGLCVDRLIELAASERLPGVAVIDRSGHHRPVYRPLMVYAWLQAYRLAYETLPALDFGRWEEGLRPWCDLLEAELNQIPWPSDAMPAGRGSSATESVWMALALHVAGKVFIRDAWTDLAADTFGKLMRCQQPGGAFLLAGPSDNPDTHVYHELVLLHAAASYAVQAEDRTLAAALQRNARFHVEQTQPDHATAQPWGVFAFIWDESSRTLADQMLHTAGAQHPQALDGVSRVLLTDALYCLRLFEPPAGR